MEKIVVNKSNIKYIQKILTKYVFDKYNLNIPDQNPIVIKNTLSEVFKESIIIGSNIANQRSMLNWKHIIMPNHYPSNKKIDHYVPVYDSNIDMINDIRKKTIKKLILNIDAKIGDYLYVMGQKKLSYSDKLNNKIKPPSNSKYKNKTYISNYSHKKNWNTERKTPDNIFTFFSY